MAGTRAPDRHRAARRRLCCPPSGASAEPGAQFILAGDAAGAFDLFIDDQRRGGHDGVGDDLLHLGHMLEIGRDAEFCGRFAGELFQAVAFGAPRSKNLDKHGELLGLCLAAGFDDMQHGTQQQYRKYCTGNHQAIHQQEVICKNQGEENHRQTDTLYSDSKAQITIA